MNDTLTITVEHLQRGQPRPYADHEYRAEITVEGSHPWNRLREDAMRELVRIVVHSFTDDEPDGTMAGHFRPRLTELRCLTMEQEDNLGARREVWLAEVREPYCD